MKRLLVFSLGGLLLGIAADTAFVERKANVASTAPAQPTDAAILLACKQFVPLVTAVDAGIITNAELRDVIQSVDELANSQPNSEVAITSRRLLSILTTGRTERQMKETLVGLMTACGDVEE